MAKKQRKGRYHASRTSGHQKFLRAKDYDEFKVKKKKVIVKPLDLSKGDWSL